MAEAEAMFRRALEGYEKAWGPEHTSTLDTVHTWGFIMRIKARWPKRKPCIDGRWK
ncbi:tpr repeat protein, partial [Lasallia pustulata]